MYNTIRLPLFVCANKRQVTEERKKGRAIISAIWRCNDTVVAVNGVPYMVPERLTGALSVCGLWSMQRPMRTEMASETRWKAIPPCTHSGHLRDKQPSGLLGHPQAHGQADDQIHDQQQKIGQPSKRQERTHQYNSADWALSLEDSILRAHV